MIRKAVAGPVFLLKLRSHHDMPKQVLRERGGNVYLLLGIISGEVLLHFFSKNGVEMIIGVYRFVSNVNKSSVIVFITTINSSVAEAGTCTMKYFNKVSELYVFLTSNIKGINDIRLISRPIHAPNRELEDTDTNIPPTDRLCGLVVRVSGYRYRGPGFDPRRYQIF